MPAQPSAAGSGDLPTQLLDRLKAFEDAWEASSQPRIEDFLPTDGPDRLSHLVAIVRVTLERRIKAGEPVRAEEYLARFPELRSDAAVVADLVRAEYRCRRRHESRVDVTEYAERFPELGNQLSELLNALEAEITTCRDWTPRPEDVPPVTTRTDPIAAGPRYRPLRFHARGGLGEVHVAADEELHREVALKCIQKEYVGSPSLRRRFLVEAEVTARLQHPGVVPVYGLVHDDAGLPWYAMRFIEGESLAEAIKRFHDAANEAEAPVAVPPRLRVPVAYDSLEFRQLLQRFIAVCNTIAYAHSRGIIHRDLKPSNIMLGKYGETLVVDWGLARAFDRRTGCMSPQSECFDESTLAPTTLTELDKTPLGQDLGTPAFMSPEQAAGRWDIIGPASDTYSLGVTLYVLLTGEAPFKEPNKGLLLFAVQQGEFPPPRKVKPAVPKALETICLKAMAHKPDKRYATALDLAKDVDRWLADEPVSAYPEPVAVRLRRWGRRHRTVVASAAALLVAAVPLSIALAVISDTARHQAEADKLEIARQKTLAEENANAAKESDDDTKAFSKFLVEDVLAVARPEEQEGGLGVNVTVRKALETAASKIAQTFAGRPRAEAVARADLGVTFLYIGDAGAAIRELERAHELERELFGPTHSETITGMNNLAHAYLDAGRLADALALFEETLKLARETFGPTDPKTLTSMNSLASAYDAVGRSADALPLFEETLELRRKHLGPGHPDTLNSMHSVAYAYQEGNRRADALLLYKEVVKLTTEKLGPAHPATLSAMHNLAFALRDAGRRSEALPLFQKTLKLMEDKLGPTHPTTLACMNNLALTHQDLDHLTDALPLFEKTLKLREERLGQTHPSTLTSMHNLAAAYRDGDRLGDALSLFEKTLELRTQHFGRTHPGTLYTMHLLALTYSDANRLDEALPLFKETLELRKEKLGRTHPDTLYTMHGLACAYRTAGRLADALPLFEETLVLRKEYRGPTHPDTLETLFEFAKLRIERKDYVAAEALLLEQQEGAEQNAKNLPPAWQTDAIPHFVRLYDAWGKPDEAEKWRKKLPPRARIRDALQRDAAWPLLWGWPRF